MRQGTHLLRLAGFSILWLIASQAASAKTDLSHTFATPPTNSLTQTPCLPTPNQHLYQDEQIGFAARTRTNDDYGFPGWTRESGGRFHKGVDILPVNFDKIDRTVRIEYYDAKTKKNYSRNEPVLIPKDEIYSILDGVVVVANKNENYSGYGRYVTIQHQFADGKPFISMYAHLKSVDVVKGQKVKVGDRIGWMGNTSSSAGGRTYLKAIPHCHFEIGRLISDMSSMLSPKRFLSRAFGVRYTTSNIQPYNPIEFLRKFRAQPKSQWALENSGLALTVPES
jgi:hypothetical protein